MQGVAHYDLKTVMYAARSHHDTRLPSAHGRLAPIHLVELLHDDLSSWLSAQDSRMKATQIVWPILGRPLLVHVNVPVLGVGACFRITSSNLGRTKDTGRVDE